MAATVQLNEVTLVTITAVNIDQTHAVLQQCLDGMAFGAVKMFCPQMPAAPDPRIQYLRIPEIDIKGYDWILLRLLHRHIETSHCLIVQEDGFIVAPERWEPEFLAYDYIGAPWLPQIHVWQNPRWVLTFDGNRVGNGGFSLRSKRLLQAVAAIPAEAMTFPVMSEDVVICHYLYDRLTAQGFRFAPLDVAARFAVETEEVVPGQKIGNVFGFHGTHLLAEAGAILAAARPCACGSNRRFGDCHGRYLTAYP